MGEENRKDNDELVVRFGKRIRQLRLERGVGSQDELGDRANLHRTFIGRVERGETNITLENIYKLATALGVSLAELFESFKEVIYRKESEQDRY